MERVHIDDDDNVLRRVKAQYIENGRFTSSLFHDRDDKPSVHLARIVSFSKVLTLFPDTLAFAVLNVGDIHRDGLGVVSHDPRDEDESHCLIERTPNWIVSKHARAKQLKKLVWDYIIMPDLSQR